MTTLRSKRRDKWRQTENGTWTISLGSRGHRVRLFQNRREGAFYREVHLPGGKKHRVSLETSDRVQAEKIARELVAVLIVGDAPPVRSVVRLRALFEAFFAECAKFLDNKESTKRDDRIRAEILCGYFRDLRDVSTLTEDDIVEYAARRKLGGISYSNSKATKPVRQRSVQADVKFLKQVLRWACIRTLSDGRRWLDLNPLQHVTVRAEHDRRQPVASYERFEATRDAMRQLQQDYAALVARAETEKSRARAESRYKTWVRAELALTLLEVTGRRRAAVMALRWTDFNSDTGKVTWQAENDKVGKTWTVDHPASFFQAIADFQRRLGADEGFVFGRRGDDGRSAPAELLSQWILTAERKAGLAKLPGSTAHSYRRKWKTERNHLPLKAVMEAGGWSDMQTALGYDHPTPDDILAVTSEGRKYRDIAST